MNREESRDYIAASNKEIFRKASNKGSRAFGFSYLKDLAEYSGKNNAFNDTYSNNSEVVRFGLLSFSFKKFINKGGVNFAYRVNSSVGLNQAPALLLQKLRGPKKILVYGLSQ